VKCSDFLKELSDYLDNTMDAKTKADLEEHLQWCHNCYVVCNTTKSTIEIYRGTEVYELPDELRGRLQSAILSKCECHSKAKAEVPAKAEPAANTKNSK
jgi:predicted anti-sigma-YlaC factor YlaD